MSYGQRERMIQLEINNLIENKEDGISMASLQRKLNYGDAMRSVPNITPKGRISSNKRRSNVHDDKLNQLRGIYSEYRLDGGHQRVRGQSPRSHANQLTFEAS